jgi:hypothetical protein
VSKVQYLHAHVTTGEVRPVRYLRGGREGGVDVQGTASVESE